MQNTANSTPLKSNKDMHILNVTSSWQQNLVNEF